MYLIERERPIKIQAWTALEPWPLRCRCSAPPVELSGQLGASVIFAVVSAIRVVVLVARKARNLFLVCACSFCCCRLWANDLMCSKWFSVVGIINKSLKSEKKIKDKKIRRHEIRFHVSRRECFLEWKLSGRSWQSNKFKRVYIKTCGEIVLLVHWW